MHANSKNKMKICIIGSGAAGIITAASILEFSNNTANSSIQISIFDSAPSKSLGFGGIFNPERIRLGISPVYPSLRSNLPTILMENPLLDWNWKEFKNNDVVNAKMENEFPSHTEMSNYLLGLVEKYRLDRFANFGHQVTKISSLTASRSKTNDDDKGDRINNSLFVVSGLKKLDEDFVDSFSESFDRVIVCTGRFNKPKVMQFPDWQNFEVEKHFVHSTQINWATFEGDYHDQHVAVVGAGSSARDILLQLLLVAKPKKICWINSKLRSRFGSETENILNDLQQKQQHQQRENDGNTNSHFSKIEFIEENFPDFESEIQKRLLFRRKNQSENDDCDDQVYKFILATGFENPENGIEVAGFDDIDAATSSSMKISTVGQRGFVAPMAMLYYEAQEWINQNLVSSSSFLVNDEEVKKYSPSSTFRRTHPEDIPGELPFTAFADILIHGRENGEEGNSYRNRVHFKQHLFEIAEKRLCQDFTSYREVRYRGDEALLKSVKEQTEGCF